jgi:inosine-uridine nucleoside N-ribohydrolase
MATHAIILDTDPGIDDAMALFLALRSPEVTVVGLTTVFGNSTVEATTRNALNLLHVAGRTDIPVAQGAARPMVLSLGKTGEFVHGQDAMGDIGWTDVLDPDLKPVDQPAAQFIVEQVMSNPGQITLAAIGPLTNLALALQLEPRIAQTVRSVVIMGGSVSAPGNVSPTAEANIYNDPHAAELVFGAGWALTMVGLDVTTAVRMDEPRFAALRNSAGLLGRFVGQIAPCYQRFHHERYGYQDGAVDVHDPSAIAYLIDPTLFRGHEWRMVVPVDGPARGTTIADRRDHFLSTPKVNCLTEVDAPRVLNMLQTRLAT